MTPRFGILTLQPAPYDALAERWRRVEAMGFDSIWVADGLTTGTASALLARVTFVAGPGCTVSVVLPSSRCSRA